MSPEEMFDPIKRPAHYVSNGIEAIDVIEAFAPANYHRGNALKYLLRADKKDATAQDLGKAKWYIEREIAALETAQKPAMATATEPYPEGCERCKGWTWKCHKEAAGGDVCGHECEYPVTAAEQAITYQIKVDERLPYFCPQHRRWHDSFCPSCAKEGSSR